MKRNFIVGLAVSASLIAVPLSAANAADMPVKAPPLPPAPVYSWTGCYIGGNVGYGWQQTGQTDSVGVHLSDTETGVVGGGQIGCDRQLGTWVIGIQGMFNWSGISGSQAWPTNSRETETINARWFDTLTARIGYTLQPQTLIYLKGGAAWLRNSYTDNCPTCTYFGSGSATSGGWTVGGGLEYKFDRNWSAFLEYDYIDVGNRNTTLNYVAAFPLVVTYNYSHTLQTVLAGINYSFGDWWAKY